MYIDELLDRTEYLLRWRSAEKFEVHAYKLIRSTLRPGTERVEVGCVAIGTEAECRKYIGGKIGGLAMNCGKLYHTKGAVA